MVEGHSVHRIAVAHTRRLCGKHYAASSPNGRFAHGASLVDGPRRAAGALPLRTASLSLGSHQLQLSLAPSILVLMLIKRPHETAK